jgi:hypothetical protein
VIEFTCQILLHTETRKSFQPFWAHANLLARKSSSLLQRKVVDFTSHRSFRESLSALEEHYGFVLPFSAAREITGEIGRKAQHYNASIPLPERTASQLIVQMDGSMVPVVEYAEATAEQQEQGLKRNRNCHWKEFRLATVNLPGESSTHYGVTRGQPFEAGCMMYQTARQKGLSPSTWVHGVADGATWIAEQYEVQFGEAHRFVLDFYHTCDYLAAASKDLPKGKDPATWFQAKKEELKKGRSGQVIAELDQLSAQHQEENSALSVAANYLENRKNQLGYQSALAEGLPIGSGTVESGHRSVLQSRLKRSGAWWKPENAETMAHLKVVQANQNWNSFWEALAN